MMHDNVNTWEQLLTRQSVQALIFANMIPLLGVLFWNWSLFSVMFLYWLETVIIGIFNVLRMSRAEGPIDPEHNATLNGAPYTRKSRTSLIVFFCIHFGIFTIVHGAFISLIFGPFDLDSYTFLIGLSALLVSHAVSYRINFIGKEEYTRVTETMLFFQPYKRIVLMHFSIMAGAFLVQLIGVPILALVFFVFLKTSIDVWAHTREHANPDEAALLTGA